MSCTFELCKSTSCGISICAGICLECDPRYIGTTAALRRHLNLIIDNNVLEGPSQTFLSRTNKTFMFYEPLLLGMGVVFNTLITCQLGQSCAGFELFNILIFFSAGFGAKLRGPTAILFISPDTSSDSTEKTSRTCCYGVSHNYLAICCKIGCCT